MEAGNEAETIHSAALLIIQHNNISQQHIAAKHQSTQKPTREDLNMSNRREQYKERSDKEYGDGKGLLMQHGEKHLHFYSFYKSYF